MSTFDPNDPFPDERRRSSPIPGVSDAPPPGSAPPHGAAPDTGWTMHDGGGVAPPGFTPTWTPVARLPPRMGLKILLAIVLPIVLTAGILVFVAMTVEDATDQFDGILGDRETEALGLDVEVSTLFETPALVAVASAVDDGVPGTPTEFVSFNVFPDYVVADARSPTDPTDIDQYIWRGGSVGAPTPQTNIDEIESLVFSLADIDWTAIGDAVARALRLTDVEEGEVSYLVVRKGLGDPISITVYVNGPRDSAYVALSPTGEVLSVN